MNPNISPDSWRAVATSLGIEEATLRAVAEVESAGQGFLPLPSELPRVLFEGHAFHRLTHGRFSASHPTISYPKWTKTFYAKTGAGEWRRLEQACDLDRPAALQSASWGAFQIMGFNYGQCGFSDVEAFVAAHKAGAERQLECFTRFISRDAFLVPLRNRDWAAFASSYNGPAYAKNRYDAKLAAAYARHAAASRELTGERRAARRARRRTTTRRRPLVLQALPPGRPEFAPAPSPVETRRPFRRSVKPDPVDLRDWLYHPSIAVTPPLSLLPSSFRPVKNQGNTSACTGFSLATTIEYLQVSGKRDPQPISGYMLYSMARRYDEWRTDDQKDEGSSLRGALKGWSRHGASAATLWSKLAMPQPTNSAKTDWWLDALTRPLGAYYRIRPESIADIHIALAEIGVVYASALTHEGWDALHRDRPGPLPTSVNELPLIDCHAGDPDAGHAFAIIGYTDTGFVVQNSWGRRWGRGGFAILTYGDWRQNAMDCWIAQLGVVTTEHCAVSEASTLRVVGDRVVLATAPRLATHEITPFVVDMQNEGRLSDRGEFRTTEADLEALLDYHLDVARRIWSIPANGAVDVAIYAHGGLVSETDAAADARTWIPLLYSNRIFPIFLMWETDALNTVLNMVSDAILGEEARVAARRLDRLQTSFAEWKNERIEGVARVPGGALWRQMKDNADDLSSTAESGVLKLFRLFQRRRRRASFPNVRLHLIGHSAGAIVQTHLAARALRQGFTIDSMSLLAPAVRIDRFHQNIGAAIAAGKIRILLGHLTDAAELADPTCQPYGHSLLYLVSRSFEDRIHTPLLGLERHLVPSLVAYPWGRQVMRLASPGGTYQTGGKVTSATSHGAFDNDPAVQDAVVRHIKGPAFTGDVARAL